MKPLTELRPELKALNTAALLYALLGILMALSYIDVSHSGTSGYMVTPHDIAHAYYGPGMSDATLIGLAHIHLLALLPIFWIIGFIFVHSRISTKWRIFWCVLPFVMFPIDVAGWFLTHHIEGFVYQTIIGGFLFILSLVVMIFVSLYEMWVVPFKRNRQKKASAG